MVHEGSAGVWRGCWEVFWGETSRLGGVCIRRISGQMAGSSEGVFCRTRRRSHKTKDWRSITRRSRLIVVEARRMGITNTAELSDASNCGRRSVVHRVRHHVGCIIGLLKKPSAGAGRTDRRIKSDFGAKFTEVRPIRPEPCASSTSRGFPSAEKSALWV